MSLKIHKCIIENLPSKSSEVPQELEALEIECKSCLKCTLFALPMLVLWSAKLLMVSLVPAWVSGRGEGDQCGMVVELPFWKPTVDGRSWDTFTKFLRLILLWDFSSLDLCDRFDWMFESLVSEWTFPSTGLLNEECITFISFIDVIFN